MKRIALRLMSLFMVFALSAAFCPRSSAARGELGQITADGVNMRESPNKDSTVIMELPLNAEVEILDESGGWYRVMYAQKVGYVRQDYVFVASLGSRAAYVIEDEVKLRGAPSITSYVVADLSAGQGVRVKELIGEWYFTIANDQSGYVHKSYLTLTKGAAAAGSMLRIGMEGQEVKKLQTELNRRGFLPRNDVTGVYGAKTRTAVAQFQKAAELAGADGIAGTKTLSVIYDPSNNVRKENAQYNQIKGSVVLLDWFKGGSDWLSRGTRFTITDVRTGLSFKCRRFGGWYHADSEPLTAADTAVFKRIVNGVWTWNRRAIWVTANGKTVAASMNCMPHLVSPTKTNNFDGHFCVHLYKSKVHENSKECPRHQAAVMEAYRKGKA